MNRNPDSLPRVPRKEARARRPHRSAPANPITHSELLDTLNRMSDGFMVLDGEWTILYMNSAGRRVLRQDKPEGWRLYELFPYELAEPFYECYADAFRSQEPRQTEAYYAPLSKWFEANAWPSEDRLTVYFRDVTQRRAYYDILTKQNEMFSLVAQATRDVVFDWDVVNDSVWRSDAVATVLGYEATEEDPSSEWWISKVHPDDVQRCRAELARYLAPGGGFILSLEYRFLKRDGSWATLMTRSCAKRDESGRALRVIGAATDVTRQREAEMHLAESKRRLVALSRRLLKGQEEERRRIARDLHDQLGQSLTGLKYALASVSKEVSPDSLQEMNALVDDTIDDIRRIARELRPPLLDQLGLMPALELEVEAFARRTGLQATMSGERSITLPPELAIACFRVVQEALTNVARHARATRVEVEVSLKNKLLEIRITDDGCGIPMEAVSKGSSLGIAGMFERAHLMSGDLSLEPLPDGGTLVLLTIPLSQQRTSAG